MRLCCSGIYSVMGLLARRLHMLIHHAQAQQIMRIYMQHMLRPNMPRPGMPAEPAQHSHARPCELSHSHYHSSAYYKWQLEQCQ